MMQHTSPDALPPSPGGFPLQHSGVWLGCLRLHGRRTQIIYDASRKMQVCVREVGGWDEVRERVREVEQRVD